MRNITGRIIGALTALLVAAAPAWAVVEKDFGAGSLVIPMDSTYQPQTDGGMLNAYGLVFELLSHTDKNGDNDITVYWIIDDQKVAIDDPDIVIDDKTLASGASTSLVAAIYNHAGGTSGLTTFATGDSSNHISYAGAPFVIDAADAAKAKAIIDKSIWAAVDVHQMLVPFKAPVYREMNGTPPRIALMNDSEDKTKGNATKILEAYLRYAGICNSVYDIITPNEIRDGALFDSSTGEYKYDFLWTPHWAGYESYDTDANGDGISDVEQIVQKVREFVEAGNGLFAECASIEVFEHSSNGHFLTDKGIAQNGGWNDPAHIVYNDVTTPNSQVGDFFYEPTGGHLHNWRPFKFGDDTETSLQDGKTLQYMKGKLNSPQQDGIVTAGNDSHYNDTVTRFTIDDGRDTIGGNADDWDYYVGGYIDGNSDEGYVVYLGGHKYAECKSTTSTTCTNKPDHRLRVTFAKPLSTEQFLLEGKNGATTSTITFSADAASFDAMDGTPLRVEVDSNTTVSGNVIEGILFSNQAAAALAGVDMNLTWAGDTDSDGQYITKIEDITDSNKLLYSYSPTVAVSGWVPKPSPDVVNSGKVNEYDLEMDKVYSNESFTMTVYYRMGAVMKKTVFTFDFNTTDGSMQNLTASGDNNIQLVGGKLDIKKDKKTGKTSPGNKIKGLQLKATGGNAEIVGVQIQWTGGTAKQNVKKYTRKKQDGKKADMPYNTGSIPGVVSGTTHEPTSITLATKLNLDAPCNSGCTDTSGCTLGNLGGVRYVLNTLFNIKYQIRNHEYVRSAPIAYGQYLYQGTFEYPSYRGHFRKIDLSYSDPNDPAAKIWDTADAGHIKDARDGNCLSDGATPPDCQIDTTTGEVVRDSNARQVFTATNASGSWELLDFDKFHINYLRSSLNVTPTDGDDSDEIAVIERLRGKKWDPVNKKWIENPGNRMGGIMHSAPAIATTNDEFGRIYDLNGNGYDDRHGVYYDLDHDKKDDVTGNDLSTMQGVWVDVNNDTKNDLLETVKIPSYDSSVTKETVGSGTVYHLPEVAYVGDVQGMLHAIDIATGNEIWAFIPPNLLGKLKNDRTDPNAVTDFAAVDASVNMQAVFYDHDGDGHKEWRRIITCAEGKGGNYVFAMDVTDPYDPKFLWETTGPNMAYAYKTAMARVAEPQYVTDANGNRVYYGKDANGAYVVDDTFGFVFYANTGSGYVHYVWKDVNGTMQLVSYSGAKSGDIDYSQKKSPMVYDYKTKYYVYVATGYKTYTASNHGGINVYAIDLLTGNVVWTFSQAYDNAVNDIPGPVAAFDRDYDRFADSVFVGDMNGRMWELDALTGENPHGTDVVTHADGTTETKEIPLYNAGVDQPISVSPTVGRVNGETVVLFGTGGADWADKLGTYQVVMVSADWPNDAPAYDPGWGRLVWSYSLPQGYKVWSSPRLHMGSVYVAVSNGTMESDDPRQDLAGDGKVIKLAAVDADNDKTGDLISTTDTKKIRATMEVSRGQSLVIGVSVDNEVITTSAGASGASQTDVSLRSWRTR